MRRLDGRTALITGGARGIGFARIEVAGGGTVPEAGEFVLVHGTLLQEQRPGRIEQQHLRRAVHQAALVDHAAAFAADDPVVFVDDVEEFLADRDGSHCTTRNR